MKNNIRYKGNTNNTSVIIFFKIKSQKLPAMVLCLGEPPRRFLLLLIFSSLYHLHFIFVSSFHFRFSLCCCSSYVGVRHSHLLFDIIPHSSVYYRRVFTPILYFQPGPLQRNSRHFNFQPFRYLLAASAMVVEWAFFTLALSPTFYLPFNQGAGNSWFFLGLQGFTWWSSKNIDLAQLFFWCTVINNFHGQNDSFLNSTKYYYELLVVKVNLSVPYSFRTLVTCSKHM